MPLPHEVSDRSDAQYGVFGRFQVVTEDGPIRDNHVQGWRRRKLVEARYRGVYGVTGSGRSRRQDAMAALLRARPEARLTGPFVLGLLDVDGFTVDDEFEVLTVPGRRLCETGFAHRPDPCPDRIIATVGPLHIVVPTDALLETAAMLDPSVPQQERRLRVGLDSATWRGLTSPARVLARARELGPEHAGAAFFLELLADAAVESDTDGERVLGGIMDHFDPPPERQVWVLPKRRSDFFLRDPRLAVEYQGRTDHGFASRRAADLVRDQELEAVGIAVLPVTADDLRDPDAAARWIQAAVVRRAFEVGVEPPRWRD
jgi:hypothetical protein